MEPQKKPTQDPLANETENNIHFKHDLSMLTSRATDFFNQMMACNLNFPDNHHRIFQMAQLIKSKIDQLCDKHLVLEVERKKEAQIEERIKKKIKNLKLEVQELNAHKEWGVIGDDWTYLALKNPTSYLIGTRRKGLKIIEDNSLIYKGKLPGQYTKLVEAIYIEPLNTYLLYHNKQIFRKDINQNPPYPFINIKCGVRFGACFKYSKIQNQLIINKDYTNLAAVNLQAKAVEIEVEKTVGKDLKDFKIFGLEDTRVASVSIGGFVFVYQLNYNEKRGAIVESFKIDLIEQREEEAQSIAVCGKNQYFLVEIGQKYSPYRSSRMIILQFRNYNLTQISSIDCLRQGIGYKYPLEFYRYFGRFILWVGLSRNERGVIQVYGYDTVNRELKELRDKRVLHQELYPAKVQRVGEEFYYTGHEGKLVRLSIKIE